ncbi:MAG: AmmeMemoRadiSam system protein B [Candidatus Magasanikbacteria bacterium RIFOXYD2_FULL_39_9]|uniref:AmmeMemoRadiSam system protein B n=1 Tax=Candidatus Magasanikbacteria bacterium RIFOXYD1_FULL_40_23 TaxID=1798705 RepID=A0A1F6PBA4_9BACT|nr:MAG: AmmeMemoRadiSam system protein B [Candidatus Magasanikbacteria bacterium RIFOXYD2_FULL_39_9]OGH93330.1 MAG: AmmeMemoRadiSam system protein B [Candidatus Magasanikbacteria bacterium RIFOXYD1_FULL_40_23]
MSLVFAGITPHPPLLIPSIGQGSIKKLEKTKLALEQMEKDLYTAHPEILIIISPHGHSFKDAFTLNINPDYQTDLRAFGDLATKVKFHGDTSLSTSIREAASKEHIPTTMISEPNLDHGASVPLVYLTPHLKNLKIIPIGFCDLDFKTHLNFGAMIKEKIADTNKRVAVIASGDLSHALITDAPAGYSAAGPEFDNKIQELLASHNLAGMLQLDKTLVTDAAECGFRSFLILMGVLQGVRATYKSYAYESPFGVGYLTANFVL